MGYQPKHEKGNIFHNETRVALGLPRRSVLLCSDVCKNWWEQASVNSILVDPDRYLDFRPRLRDLAEWEQRGLVCFVRATGQPGSVAVSTVVPEGLRRDICAVPRAGSAS